MKIWTVTINDDTGLPAPTVHHTEADAAKTAREWLSMQWAKWQDAKSQMPEDWQEAHEILSNQAGFMDSVSLAEHDISDHPTIAFATQATALAEDMLGKLMKGDLNHFTDQAAILDAYDAAADANCLLQGLMQGDDPTLGLSPNLEAALADQEAAYRAAAKAYATDDLEFDDEPAVSLGDDEGAFVSCWKWITAAEAGLGDGEE